MSFMIFYFWHRIYFDILKLMNFHIFSFFLDPWLHRDVEFNSKLGLPPGRFLGQTNYGFEAKEVKNPMLQMITILS